MFITCAVWWTWEVLYFYECEGEKLLQIFLCMCTSLSFFDLRCAAWTWFYLKHLKKICVLLESMEIFPFISIGRDFFSHVANCFCAIQIRVWLFKWQNVSGVLQKSEHIIKPNNFTRNSEYEEYSWLLNCITVWQDLSKMNRRAHCLNLEVKWR